MPLFSSGPLDHAPVDRTGRALYSPRETEAILGISHASLYRLIAAGRLDARKLGSKTLITAESVERLIAELPKLHPSSIQPQTAHNGAAK
jgi:excisionase family DNA binding protein